MKQSIVEVISSHLSLIWLYVCKTSSSFHFPYPLAFVCLLKETSVLRLANRSCSADGVFVCVVLLSLVYREKKQYSITVQSFLIVVMKTTIVCKFWRLAFFENFFTGAIQQTPCY